MKIIDNDNLQAFISRCTYDWIENTPFVIAFVLQINWKIKTTYANIYTVSAETYNKKHKNNDCVLEYIDTNYVIENESELSYTIQTLHNLWYNIWKSEEMWNKIKTFITKFY